MPNITNVEAIKFCNEQVRPFADQYGGLIFAAQKISDAWTAKGIGALVPNTADLLADGAVTGPDGRTPISGAEINAFATNVAAFLASVNASSGAVKNAILKIAVNPR